MNPFFLVLCFSFSSTHHSLLPPQEKQVEKQGESKSIAYWINQLRKKDVAERAAAADALTKKGGEALPTLISLFEDKDHSVRRYAASIVEQIGPDAVPELIKCLEDFRNLDRYGYSRRILVRLGSHGVPSLLPLLKRRSPSLPHTPYLLLMSPPPSMPAVLPLLKNAEFWWRLQNNDLFVRNAAFNLLTKIGPEAKEAVPALIGLLADKDQRIRFEAVKVLVAIDPNAQEARSTLIALVKDEDQNRRATVCRELPKMGPAAKDVVPTLMSLLKSQDPFVRHNAADTLGQLGTVGKESIPTLITLLKGQDKIDRTIAATSLVKMGAESIPALVIAIKDNNEAALVFNRIVRAAREATRPPRKPGDKSSVVISYPGQVKLSQEDARAAMNKARQAVPDLIRLLKNEDNRIRRDAANVLGAIGPEAKDAVPHLIGLFTDKDRPCVLAAMGALAAIGPDAREAVPALIGVLTQKDRSLNQSAIVSLGRMGSAAKDAAPDLITFLQNKNRQQLGYAAATSLGQIGPEAKSILPALVALLQDESPGVRQHTAMVVGKFGGLAKDAVPGLVGLLKDKEELVRLEAAQALGQIGPEARKAIPELRHLLQDEKSKVRVAAMVALGNLQAKEAFEDLLNAWKKELGKIAGPDRSIIGFSPYSQNVTSALARFGPDIVPDLLRLRNDPNDRVLSGYATLILFEIGPGAKAAIAPLLVELKQGKSVSLLFRTICSGHEELVPDLIPLLKLRVAASDAAIVLRTMGLQAIRKEMPTLMGLLKHPTAAPFAAELLGRLGPEAKDALPALIAILDTHSLVLDFPFHAYFVHALIAIGDDAAEIRPTLRRLLYHDDGLVQSLAAKAIARNNQEK